MIKFTMKSDMEKLDVVVFSLAERLGEADAEAKLSEYREMRGRFDVFKERVGAFVENLVFLAAPEECDEVLELVARLSRQAIEDGSLPPIHLAACSPALKLEHVYQWRRKTLHKNAALEATIRELKCTIKNLDDKMTMPASVPSSRKQEKWFIRMMGDLYWAIGEMNRGNEVRSGEN